MSQEPKEAYETVLRTAELGPGHVTEVRAHGQAIALVNVSQTYYALDAVCPVDGTNLGREGHLEGECLVCPADHAAFDVATGAEAADGRRLRRWGLRVEGNEIRVALPKRS